jgi:hypothetical protein
MVTQSLDRAFAAMDECRRRTPDLTAVFGPGTPEREALNALIAALDLAQRALRTPPKA